jgi:hypothetical protein
MQHVPDAFAKDFHRLAHDTKLARLGSFPSGCTRETISFAPGSRKKSNSVGTATETVAVDLYCCGYMEKVSSARLFDPAFGVIVYADWRPSKIVALALV